MNDLSMLRELLPLLAPLLVLQLILIVAALLDLSKRGQTRGPKWIWVLVIVFVNFIGPLLYFLVGRDEA